MRFSYFTKVVGTTFENRQEVIAEMRPSTKLKLRREPENKYDANAIAIDALVDSKWVPVGFIAKEKNEKLAKEIDRGTKVSITLKEVTGGGDKNYGMNVAIEYEPAGDVELVRLIPDIGIGYVMFDELNHVYFDEDGNRMISGSVFEEEHAPINDFSYAAKAMGRSTGVKPDEILGLWEENRDLSAEYGTVVHKGMEVYFKNHELMKRLDVHKERAHTATTYMPQAVGDIVDKYLARHPEDYASRCSSEVFVRRDGRCGFVDLVEQAEGGLVTHDFKFVKQLKQVKYREYGVHNKYTLQQSFYASIIKANGHNVVASYLDVYSEGEWTSHKVKLLDV